MRSGWNMPPGCFRVPGDEPAFCSVCGQVDDACICPECPVCRTHGNPTCYSEKAGALFHGLNLNRDQLKSRYKIILYRAEAKVREVKNMLVFLDKWRPDQEPQDLGEELISAKFDEQPDPSEEVRLTYE